MVIGTVVSEILGGSGTTPQMLLHCQKEQMLLTVNMRIRERKLHLVSNCIVKGYCNDKASAFYN